MRKWRQWRICELTTACFKQRPRIAKATVLGRRAELRWSSAKRKEGENAPSYVNAKVHPDRGNTRAPAWLGLQNRAGGTNVLEMYRFYWIGHWWSASLTGITRPLANAETGAHKVHGARVAAEQERQRQRTEHKRVAEQDSESSHTFLSSHCRFRHPLVFPGCLVLTSNQNQSMVFASRQLQKIEFDSINFLN